MTPSVLHTNWARRSNPTGGADIMRPAASRKCLLSHENREGESRLNNAPLLWYWREMWVEYIENNEKWCSFNFYHCWRCPSRWLFLVSEARKPIQKERLTLYTSYLQGSGQWLTFALVCQWFGQQRGLAERKWEDLCRRGTGQRNRDHAC